MIYIILGITAFGFFVIYDINSIKMKNKYLSCSFFAGILLISGATAGIIITTWNPVKSDAATIGIFGSIAMAFMFLLVYSLFFALPFQNTYIEKKGTSKVCKHGVYALCRHPGVLWFIGFYLFAGLAFMSYLLLIAAAVFSTLNILYVLFQDRWTFRRSFKDYDEYITDTPFLLPNRKSIKRCLQTLKWKEGTVS